MTRTPLDETLGGGEGAREREKQRFNTRNTRTLRTHPLEGWMSSFRFVHLPFSFFPSIVSSRGGGERGEGKREAIPGDGLDGKTKHPGGCLRAAPVIRLAGGEAWSLAPVGVGSRAPATEKARASRRPIGRAEHAACRLGWESRLRVGESHAVRNRREYFWTSGERGRGERKGCFCRARKRERGGIDVLFLL